MIQMPSYRLVELSKLLKQYFVWKIFFSIARRGAFEVMEECTWGHRVEANLLYYFFHNL